MCIKHAKNTLKKQLEFVSFGPYTGSFLNLTFWSPRMNRLVVSLSLCLVAFLCGCNSKELTRSKATELIKAAKFGPDAKPRSEFVAAVTKNAVANTKELNFLRKLEHAGWITLVVRE